MRTPKRQARRLGLVLAALTAAAAGPATSPGAEVPAYGVAVDEPPTMRVGSPAELAAVLRSPFRGRVIVPRGADWEMCEAHDGRGRCLGPLTLLPIRSGVSLVGERGELGRRPVLRTVYQAESYVLFQIYGNDVRVEGLHLVGPSGRTTEKQEKVGGIQVTEDPVRQLGRGVLVADNELEQWPDYGVGVCGNYGVNPEDQPGCGGAPQPRLPGEHIGPHVRPADAGLVRIERNYLHHNARDNAGYGVVVGGNAYATIEGNVFDFNRHDISSDGLAYGGYVARFNYALQGGYRYGGLGGYWGQHFDVHGAGTPESRAEGHYDGGPAGERFEVAFNVFRGAQSYANFVVTGKTRPAFELRGRPELGAEFFGNVAVHGDRAAAVRLKRGSDVTLNEDRPSSFNLHHFGNRYGTDYSTEVASGDFDGDRRTDAFLANGTGWFFSRAASEPWEYLRPSNKRVGELGFADIDNDGRTDVLYRDPAGNLGYVKDGAAAGLTPLTTSPVPIGELRFGDFDGDGKTDIFATVRGQWRIWSGRERAWAAVGGSSRPLSELLFGEFDAARGTDVATVLRRDWAFSSGATKEWAHLGPRRADSFAKAVAADFDGNGRTDVAFGQREGWSVVRDGRLPAIYLRRAIPARPYGPLRDLLVGRFDGGRRASVVTFELRTETRPGAGRPRPEVVVGERLVMWRGLGSGDDLGVRSRVDMR